MKQGPRPPPSTMLIHLVAGGLVACWQPAIGILYSLCFEKQYKAFVVRT